MQDRTFRIALIVSISVSVVIIAGALVWWFTRAQGGVAAYRAINSASSIMADVTTASFSSRNVRANNTEFIRCTGDIIRPLKLRYTCVQPEVGGQEKTTEVIQVGDAQYTKSTIGWVEDKRADTTSLDLFFPLSLLEYFYTRVSLTLVSDQDGLKTYEFEATDKDISGARTLLSAVFVSEVGSGDKIKGRVIFDDQHRLVQQQLQIISGGSQGELFELSLSDFGREVAIEVPGVVISDPSQIATVEPTTREERNVRRLSDLRKISQALDRYYNDHATYPEAVVASELNLSGNPVEQALVPVYLDTLPVDPMSETYYYGYRSFGQQFELTGVIENEDESVDIYFLTE